MPNLLGMHDEEGQEIVPDNGWCLGLIALSENPAPRNYHKRLNWLIRANWGYGTTGTIPLQNKTHLYVEQLQKFAARSSGVHGYIIGNEPNHQQERPDNVYITPEHYADTYIRSYLALKNVSSQIRVIVAAPAPYHADGMPWTRYWREILKLIGDRVTPDGLSFHAYVRGMDPSYITSVTKMGPPLEDTFNGFLVYRDFLRLIPTDMKHLPTYLTEFNALPEWSDANTGVITAAYREINWWNSQNGTQKIHCLLPYRWMHDRWSISDKPQLIADYRTAVSQFSSESLSNNVEGSGSSQNTVFAPSIQKDSNMPSSSSVAFERQIDERATKRGVSIVEVSQGTAWRVKSIRWFNEQEADRVGPDHHILVDVLDEQGNRVVGVPVKFIWPTGFHTVRTEEKRGERWSANYPMSASRNEFSVLVEDGQSEMVRGIGMGMDTPGGFNAGTHTSTEVIFQKSQVKDQPVVAKPAPVQTPEESRPKVQTFKPPVLVHPVAESQYRYVTQVFGARPEFYSRYSVDGVPLKGHNGIDYGVPVGKSIVAVDRGRVVEVASDPTGYGNYVKLVHDWGETLYAHLNQVLVEVGQAVVGGQLLGKSGNTGNSSGPHLHFGMRVNPFNRKDGWGGYIDPATFLARTISFPSVDESDVIGAIKVAADETGLDWRFLASLAWAESSFNPLAVSSAGAMGLMQIMPQTWDEWADRVGVDDPDNALDNARLGAYYMLWCARQTRDEYQALWAYNWGIGNVLKGRKPPQETVAFADKVMHGYALLIALGVMD